MPQTKNDQKKDDSSGFILRNGVPAEVFLMLLESCERRLLAKCLRVSKLWFAIGIQILWREVSFRTLDQIMLRGQAYVESSISAR